MAVLSLVLSDVGCDAHQLGELQMTKVAVFGSVTMEFTFRVDEWPEKGKSVQGRATGTLGGKGLFQAVASRRMGMQTILISSVGDDIYGRDVQEKLKALYLEPCIEMQPFDPARGFCTDVAGVIVDDGSSSSSTIGCREATDMLSSEFLEDRVSSTLSHTDAVLVTFDASLDAVQRITEIAGEKKKPVVVNASPPARVRLDILQSVRYLVATAREAREWLRLRKARTEEELQTKSDLEIASLLFEQGPQGVILTLNPAEGDGCLVLDRAHPGIARRYSAYRANGQRPTGARSLFCAGVLVACAEGAIRHEELSEKEFEAKLIAFASAAKTFAEGTAIRYDALPFREAIDHIVRNDPPLTIEEIPLPPLSDPPHRKGRKGEGPNPIG